MTIGLVSMAALLAGTEIVAMTSITQYYRHKNTAFIVIAVIIYGLIVPFLTYSSLFYSAIGTVNLMWNLMTTVSMIVIGRFMFNDTLTRLHIISLLMGLASMSILFVAEIGMK
jgi:hypothetical protein